MQSSARLPLFESLAIRHPLFTLSLIILRSEVAHFLRAIQIWKAPIPEITDVILNQIDQSAKDYG